MALRGLQAPKPKESGGGIGDIVGTILGGLVGVGAAIATGGASIPATVATATAPAVAASVAPAGLGAILGGASTGMGVGSTAGKVAGGLVSPAEKEIKQTPQMDVMQRRQQSIEQSPIGQLTQAHQASMDLPEDIRAQVQEPLRLAMQRVNEQKAPRYGA